MMRPPLAAIFIGALTCTCAHAPTAPPRAAPATTASTAPSNRCPTADRVVDLLWIDASASKIDPPIVGGWRAVFTSHPELFPADSGYHLISPHDARAGGLAPLPTTVWVSSGDRPPCRAAVTRPFRSGEQFGVELAGCDAPLRGAPVRSVGLVGDGDFSGCTWSVAHVDIAYRMGVTAADGGWSVAPDTAPMPDELRGLVAARTCAAPSCEHLWVVGRAGRADAAWAYGVRQAWVRRDVAATGCPTASDEVVEILARGPAGWVHAVLPNERRPHELAGVFHDDTGARIVVLNDRGVDEAFAVGTTPPTLTPVKRQIWNAATVGTGFGPPLVPTCAP